MLKQLVITRSVGEETRICKNTEIWLIGLHGLITMERQIEIMAIAMGFVQKS